jgi:hypothetical protein
MRVRQLTRAPTNKPEDVSVSIVEHLYSRTESTMTRIRIAVLAVTATVGLLTPALAVAAPGSGTGASLALVQAETKPANCGTANTPPCEA